MKKIVVFLVSIVLATGLLADTKQRYVVATRSPVGAARGLTMIREAAGTPESEPRGVAAFQSINGFAADLTDQEVAALRKAPNVRYVEAVEERHALDIGGESAAAIEASNPFAQTVPFGIDLVRAREVWPVTRGEAVNVVVIDTGIDSTHPDLAAVYAGGFNTYDDTNNPLDDNGHGTHVSGTIAAADNNIGVVGVAPDVRLYAVKVLDAKGSGTSDKVIAALDWILQQKNTLGGRWVVNLSLGSSTPNAAEREAFGRAVDAGLVICAASGNESTASLVAPVGYPAAYRGVLAIGAVDKDAAIASFSNQGPQMAVVAPGVSVLSSVRAGTGSIAAVQSDAGTFVGAEITLSKKGTVTGPFVDCGLGKPEQFPSSVAGKIALIKRGELEFNAKTRNAVNAGAIAVIIYNNNTSALTWTLASDSDPGAATFAWPVTIALSQADGQALVTRGSSQITIIDRADDYDTFSGTSMATPHATGVAALVWSAAPAISSADVRQSMLTNAHDLGASGFDNVFGNGLADALSAAKAVAPAKFDVPVTPPPTQPASKARAVRHH
ncbi:MAG: S8 family serine peptidase [Thermoanaerobaculia bacterium]